MTKDKKIKKLAVENKALKETCEILGDSKTMHEIKESLKEIKKGNGLSLSDL